MTAQVHPTAYVDSMAVIGSGTVIGPFVSIEGPVVIGRRCRISAGARIGQEGFGYVRGDDGTWTAKPHRFSVVIGNDVHVGANACIDRGSWRDTVIESGAKIDNLVHVAHNVLIGRDCAVVACAELSGSVELGAGAYIAPGALVRERLVVGAGAVVGLGAVVVKDVPERITVAGVPARPIGAADGAPPPPKGRE